MVRKKIIKGKINKKLLRIKKNLIVYKLTEKAILQIFEKNLISFAKYNKFFYELFFNNGLVYNSIFLENLYKSFISYYFYKIKGVKSEKLNLFDYMTKGEIKRLKFRRKKAAYLRKKTKLLFKYKVKKERKIKSYFYIKQQHKLPLNIRKSRLSRFFKSRIDGRFIPNQKPFYLKNNVIHNLMNYDNFGIIIKKPKKINLTRKKFQVSTTLICNHFFQKLLASIYKNYKNFNFSIFTQKFYTRIFDFCMFKNLNIYKTNDFFIKNEVMDSEDNENAENDIEALKYHTGLTIKFVIKRRNCFFQVWDNVSGFTLAKISAGVFGYYFKKGIKRFRQFNVFVKFFRYYFNSIVVTYRNKFFKRFLTLRHIASRQFKIKKLKIFKKNKTNKNNNNLTNIIYYYKNFLTFNSTLIKLKKIYFNIKNFNKKIYLKISSQLNLIIETYYNKKNKIKTNLNLFLENLYLNNYIIENKSINYLKNIENNLINLIVLKKNKVLFILFSKIIFFSYILFQSQNTKISNLRERRIRNKASFDYYLKQKRKRKWKILKHIMSRRARYNGLNFIFYHRSKLSFTYILTMRKPFYNKKRIFSLHWVDIYTKIKRITKINRLTHDISIYNALRLYYRFQMKTQTLSSYYNLIKFAKQAIFKVNIKVFYRRYNKKASVFKITYARKYFNSLLKVKVCKYLINLYLENKNKYLIKKNKFKIFNNLNLSIFDIYLNFLKKNKIGIIINIYNKLSMLKTIRKLNIQIKNIYTNNLKKYDI